MKYLAAFLSLALLTACNTAQQDNQESNPTDPTVSDTVGESETSETHFLPENEGWVEFKNDDITFSYPKEFSVREDKGNVYLTNSAATAPLGMAQGEIWISFSPTTKDVSNSSSPNEGIAEETVATNGSDSWYKMELLMGGNGEATQEAKNLFEKVESTFRVL